MATQLRFRERLSFRLMIVSMLCALALGVVLSAAQIVVDARNQEREIGRTAEQVLAMLRQPATEAAYNFDKVLAQRVLDGLSRYEPVYRAAIIVGATEPLAVLERPRRESGTRFLTDAIFGSERAYVIPLEVAGLSRPAGELRVAVDTYPAGQAFLKRAGLVVLNGLLLSLVLAVALLGVYWLLLTRPLSRMVERLSHVDPQAPQRTRLPVLPGHERDELGVWASSANALLQAIEDHVARREAAEAQASYLQQFDRLTDLPNRTLYYDRLAQAIQRARRDHGRVALLHCDVREFQFINDKYGYETGDAALREVSRRLRLAVGEAGTIARIGGDQFGIVLADARGDLAAADLAQDILHALQEPVSVGPHRLELSLAMGIAGFPNDGQDAEVLTQNAEKALAMAKQAGNNQVHFYVAELGERFRQRRQLQYDLGRALARDELELHYQPQFRADSGELVGAEALLRWRHPENGFIPTAYFVEVAEESGAIVEIGQWVIAEACRRAQSWSDSGLPPLRIAVNVSAAQLHGPGIGRVVTEQLRVSRLAPGRLDLEVTETAVMSQIERAVASLREMRELGVGVAVDDFGTGQSSLSYLLRLPITALKIDGSFVRGLDAGGDGGDGGSIVDAIIGLAHSLKLSVIAEGVETAAQLRHLRLAGCDEIQGYFLSHPLPAAEFEALARRVPVLTPEQRRHFSARAHH